MEYADFGKRLLALMIDNVIFVILSWILFLFLGIYFLPVVFVCQWLYFSFMESSEQQATFGKKILGIKVTNMEGNRISFLKATVRFFCKIISAIVIFVGFMMAMFTDQNQALHDIIAGTLVVNRDMRRTHAVESENPPENEEENEEKVEVIKQPVYQQPVHKQNPALYGISGQYEGRLIHVNNRGLIMGRDRSYCSLIFNGNTQGISRRHCIINFNRFESTFHLMDIGSSFGTFLESGERIKQGQTVILKPGDRFYLADKKNMFEVRII